MAITDLIPWKRGERRLPIRRVSREPLYSLSHEMDRLFEQFWRDPFSIRPFDLLPAMWGNGGEGFIPRVDVSETEKEYVLTAELPGMDEKDIDIAISNNVLTIKGEKREEHEEKDRNYYYMERSFGSFCREFPLPSEVDEDKIEATFKKGVLTVTLPKLPEVIEKTRRIPIKKS